MSTTTIVLEPWRKKRTRHFRHFQSLGRSSKIPDRCVGPGQFRFSSFPNKLIFLLQFIVVSVDGWRERDGHRSRKRWNLHASLHDEQPDGAGHVASALEHSGYVYQSRDNIDPITRSGERGAASSIHTGVSLREFPISKVVWKDT